MMCLRWSKTSRVSASSSRDSGRAQRVGRGRGQPLEVAGHLVAQVADHAAVEPRQTGDVYGPVTAELLFDELEGIDVIAGARRENFRRLGAQEAVARQPLAALDTFEQEGIFPASDLEVGGHGRLQVGLYFTVDRGQVALRLEFFYFR